MPAATSPRLILKTGALAGTVYPITAELSLGRDPACDIQLDSPGVSRLHARLLLQADAILLEDLGSSNGTFVNGVRLRPSRQLIPGDEIHLGQSVAFEYQAELVHLPPVEATLFEGTQLESVITPAAPTGTLQEQLPSTNATMIGEEALPDLRRQPPQITVTIAGEPPRTYTLTRPQLHLGRSPENDLIIASPIVSRRHAILEQIHLGYQLSVLPEAANPVLFEGRPLSAPRLLQHGDTLRIGSLDPGSMVTLTFQAPGLAAEHTGASHIQFGAKTVISIGRDPANDVVLPSPAVSRFHAQVERVGQRFRLRDLRSANGTFVNDQRLEAPEVWLQPSDVVRIGRHTFRMDQDQLSQVEEGRGLQVEAYGLNKWVRKDLNILQNISLTFQPREFIVVVGQSGGGKSTLVDAIAGYRPATHGQVLVNGANVYRNFDAVRNDIGFVPQRDIIHTELTVYQALDYAAKLRMPRDTSPAERHQRITEVLEDLDLTHRKDNPITRLSGGQQKRVSIGVELLTQPGLFFLDEPTSGLDPGTETAFMHLMRRLADQGRTIVMVTHATKNVMLADKVVFLARGGYMAWFGPPDEALKYFDSYRSERERRAHSMEFDQIYAILDDPSKGSAEEWAKRFTEHAAFQQYVVQPLQARQTVAVPSVGASAPALAPEAAPAPKAKPKSRASALHQFLVLSARNLRILTRDRSSLILMLLAPILVGALDFIIAPLMGSNPYNFMSGDAANGSLTLFLLALDCLLVAGLSQMREFVKEADIYKRERLVNLKILPYVSSKVWIALLLAFYQGAAYTLIHHLAFEMPGGALEIGLFYVTMVLAAMAGMMTGLLASAIAPAASSAPMLMILLVIPQIVLSGILAPVPENISAVATTRWSFEGLIGVTGYGSDVAADPCWGLSEELRDAMTLEDKATNGCRCMGLAVFEPGSCNFPGLGQYIVPELSQVAPVEPAALPPKPAEPVIPPAPDPPADQNDQVAMVQYLNALQSYQDEVALIQEQYKSAMGLYEAQAELYQAEMESYATERLEYESARNGAVERAEGVIESVREEFGWAWVDKSKPDVFYPWLYTAWGAQIIISAVYFVIILFLIKRKDNV
jgi:ABC-type multidrug transport system ATPase subunit/pSer/pThr/pTyr-binding forkhead associated (FHA) protein